MTAVERSRIAEIMEVLTVGFPFCAFKGVVAFLLIGQGWAIGGAMLLGWAIIDVALNAINLSSLVASGRRVVSPCALSAVTATLKLSSSSSNEYLRDLGNSIDVLLSFSLVAAMVGLGQLSKLPAQQLSLWNAAVVLNVLGAGVSRLGSSVKRIA